MNVAIGCILQALERTLGDAPMIKTTIVAATAVLALTTSGATLAASHRPAHKPYTVLWNQNSNFGYGLNSQNYGSNMTGYNDAGADDFAIPSGQTWRIAEVDVTGAYFNGSGPSSSEAVTFYSNRKHRPYRIYRGTFTLNCTDNNGSFQCILPKLVKLPSGTWWVSVVANCDFVGGCGEWDWTENTTVQNNEATWENPGGSGKCTSWEPLHVCGGSPADLAFDLIGKQ